MEYVEGIRKKRLFNVFCFGLTDFTYIGFCGTIVMYILGLQYGMGMKRVEREIPKVPEGP